MLINKKVSVKQISERLENEDISISIEHIPHLYKNEDEIVGKLEAMTTTYGKVQMSKRLLLYDSGTPVIQQEIKNSPTPYLIRN